MIIKNSEDLISSSLRARAVELIETGIRQVLPVNLMRAAVKYSPSRRRLTVNGVKYNLGRGRVFVTGGGKASGLMAEELERIIGPATITAGMVNCKTGGYETEKVAIIEAGHPVPDEAGVRGVREMLAMKARYGIGKGDLVICLISGGGSALLPCPVTGVTLEDKRYMTELLLKCGADIKEINTVRKHLSMIKGGGLGGFYSPATVVALVISDVVGDCLDAIASGPTVADPTTFADAYQVLKKYGLEAKAPENAAGFILRGCDGREAETPKVLDNCANYVIGNNRTALEAVAERARDMGLKPLVVTSEMTGDTASVACSVAADMVRGRYRGYDVVLLGGETTPTLPENAGKGGRNQHYAAVSILAMRDCTCPWVVASVGSDGSDYLRDVAGAMVDNRSGQAARDTGLDVKDYVERFDSNTLLAKLGRSLVITGATGTNVSDILLYLLGC